ncbi:hypothetical protein [Aquabacterium sp.]|uniref:hypothetical protein n=1 Tax=Aquabacterium sp. TaxID=1872578 RepID=UPI002D80AF39|nr:hypothetical protein [Aquabacterium sp.]
MALLMAACGGGADEAADRAATADASAQTAPRARAMAVSSAASIAPEEAARQLMDFAQQQFPAYFPGQAATASLDPFVYRYYPATGTYLGVVVKAGSGHALGSVYVLGGAFGSELIRVGAVSDFITPVAPGFDLTPAADKVVVVQGSSTVLRVNLARLPGFDAAVQLTVQGLPAGVTATAASVAAGATHVDVTIQAQAGAPHSLPTTASVRATAGDLLVTAPITVTVRGLPGDLDTSFAGGVVSTSLGASEDYAHAVAVQADGKVLTVGTTATSAGTVVGLVRHLRDGALDSGFGTAGKVVTQVGARGDSARAIAVQADGKIVVAGWTDQTGTDANFLVLRYRSDGSLDPEFAQGGTLVVPFGTGTDRAHAVAIQADGKIVVAGAAQVSGSATGQDFALIRVLPNGTLDAGFGDGGKLLTPMRAGSSGDIAYGLALPMVGGEQRILAVGGEGDFVAARYTASGALDASFGQGGKVLGLFKRNIGRARAVTLLPGGRMLLAGGIYDDFAAAQLTESGALDASFGEGGLVVHAVSAANWDNAHAVVRQADGKLVLGGWAYSGNSTSGDFVAMRLLPGGALDTNFGNAGIVIRSLAANGRNDSARGLVLQADDRISTVRAVLAGEISAGPHDFGLIRLWL